MRIRSTATPSREDRSAQWPLTQLDFYTISTPICPLVGYGLAPWHYLLESSHHASPEYQEHASHSVFQSHLKIGGRQLSSFFFVSVH